VILVKFLREYAQAYELDVLHELVDVETVKTTASVRRGIVSVYSLTADFFSLHFHHSVCLLHTHAFRVCLHQFVSRGALWPR
jgi:hypothetical protein